MLLSEGKENKVVYLSEKAEKKLHVENNKLQVFVVCGRQGKVGEQRGMPEK